MGFLIEKSHFCLRLYYSNGMMNSKGISEQGEDGGDGLGVCCTQLVRVFLLRGQRQPLGGVYR